MKKRRNKFNAKPTVVDGVRFASKREAAIYCDLKLLARAGMIADLELQPRFACSVNGKKIGTYVADFRYIDNVASETVVMDVKGMRTRLYVWKKRHVEAQYGITIREV